LTQKLPKRREMLDDKITKRKILVLDDMATIREAMQSALRKLGFSKIQQSADGQDGWNKLKQNVEEPFGLIFSDINMPNCNGIEFVKLLRTLDVYKSIPVIMVSSENESHIILDAIAAGANNYVLKPFTPNTIEQKITEVFNKLK